MLTFVWVIGVFVVISTKTKEQKKDTFRIWHGQLEIEVFFHKLVLGKNKDNEGLKEH